MMLIKAAEALYRLAQRRRGKRKTVRRKAAAHSDRIKT
jgi:hypothetical protein